MEIIVYDFDKTIYDGDSTLDFYLYCIRKNPEILKYLPIQVLYFIKYKIHKISKTEFKEKFYIFLNDIKNVNLTLNDFWKINEKKIKKFYIEKNHSKDVIISASPYFLLEPIVKKYGAMKLIASNVNKENGKYTGKNCYGEEKVSRLQEEIENFEILEFYSDSSSDLPLAKLAKDSFIVRNNRLEKWRFCNEKKRKK